MSILFMTLIYNCLHYNWTLMVTNICYVLSVTFTESIILWSIAQTIRQLYTNDT